jgi:hypothetical protein
MAPTLCAHPAPVPPPSYHRILAAALHLDALTLVICLQLLEVCRAALQLAQRHCPPPLPAGPGGAPRVYTEETLLLLALLHTLWPLMPMVMPTRGEVVRRSETISKNNPHEFVLGTRHEMV